MATPRLFPTCNPSARAAAHRAMARAALFSDSSAATRLKRYNHHMSKVRHLEARGGLPLFVIYLARSTTRLEIYAPTWQDALRQTGSADACLVNQAGERAFEVTFDPDSPTIIDFRLRYGSADDALRAVLAHVVHQLDAQALSESTRRTLAECADGMEPGAYSEAAKQAERPELSPTARRRLMRAYDVLRLEQQRQGGES